MSEYTPTTNHVRARYIDNRAGIGWRTSWDESAERKVESADAEFNRWLAEVRREAWDEAVDTLSRHWEDFAPAAVADLERRNPYRKEADRG